MLKLNVRNSLLPLLLSLVLAGCGRNGGPAGSITSPGGTSGGAQQDQAAIAAAMSAEPDLVEDGLAEDPAQMSLDAAGSTTAAIRPVTFWRRIQHVDRDFEFAFADTDSTGQPTTAFVTVRKRLLGTFNILAGTPLEPGAEPSPTDTLRTVRKPLEDHWVRHLLFKRVVRPADAPPPPGDGSTDDGRPRWRIAATSGVQVTSKDATTDIVSLRIESGALDTTVTDPLALFRLRRVLRFESGAGVQVTVTTTRNDDVVLLYLRDHRFRFTNNGDATYTATFRAGWWTGVRHFAVNALSHGTLFDDEAPYDSQAWILPYVVAPTELAQYLP